MKSKWMAIALIGSLALNLALVGFMVGRATSPGFDPARAFPRWVKTLPEPRRDQLRPLIREHFRTIRPQLAEMRSAQRAVNHAITAEPFDAEALSAALAQMRKVQQSTFASTDRSFASFVGNLSQAERQALASRGHRPERFGEPGKPPHRQP